MYLNILVANSAVVAEATAASSPAVAACSSAARPSFSLTLESAAMVSDGQLALQEEEVALASQPALEVPLVTAFQPPLVAEPPVFLKDLWLYKWLRSLRSLLTGSLMVTKGVKIIS